MAEAGGMGTFEAFYNSPIQHPWYLWAVALLALVVVLRRDSLHPTLRFYLLGLVVLSLADAWMSSHHIYGIGSLEGTAASVVPLGFVLAGDLRFLFLAVAGGSDGGLEVSGKRIAAALGLMLIVPLSTQGVLALLPEHLNTARMMFFLYELAFVLLTLALLRVHANVRAHPWIQRVCHFVILYYGLWATADAIILWLGSDLGFALRVVPNGLYYGGLIAAMAWFAPRAPASPTSPNS